MISLIISHKKAQDSQRKYPNMFFMLLCGNLEILMH